MSDLQTIAKSLEEHPDEVLGEWHKLTRQEPWLALPEVASLNHLPEVIRGLAAAALVAPGDREALAEKIWAAAQHGQDRLEQGFPEHLIHTEYHLLRRSLWRFIERNHGQSLQHYEAIARLDAATTLATAAALLGYHRAALEKRGDWPAAVERLIADRQPEAE